MPPLVGRARVGERFPEVDCVQHLRPYEVTDSCYEVADRALQLHGGYGYLREYGLEKIVRDLRVHRILEGTNEIMRVVIGRAEAARVKAEGQTR